MSIIDQFKRGRTVRFGDFDTVTDAERARFGSSFKYMEKMVDEAREGFVRDAKFVPGQSRANSFLKQVGAEKALLQSLVVPNPWGYKLVDSVMRLPVSIWEWPFDMIQAAVEPCNTPLKRWVFLLSEALKFSRDTITFFDDGTPRRSLIIRR